MAQSFFSATDKRACPLRLGGWICRTCLLI